MVAVNAPRAESTCCCVAAVFSLTDFALVSAVWKSDQKPFSLTAFVPALYLSFSVLQLLEFLFSASVIFVSRAVLSTLAAFSHAIRIYPTVTGANVTTQSNSVSLHSK